MLSLAIGKSLPHLFCKKSLASSRVSWSLHLSTTLAEKPVSMGLGCKGALPIFFASNIVPHRNRHPCNNSTLGVLLHLPRSIPHPLFATMV